MTMNEQIPVDQAFYHELFSQSDMESRASTVPLDETSSCENANTIAELDYRENDQGVRVSSRSLREVTKRDYTYEDYKKKNGCCYCHCHSMQVEKKKDWNRQKDKRTRRFGLHACTYSDLSSPNMRR
jgi:hypothetical protein